MKHYALDTRGLLCPLPVIRTQNKVKELQIGDTLEIICTDPGVLHDIPVWCRINGHEVLASRTEERDIIINIKVKG